MKLKPGEVTRRDLVAAVGAASALALVPTRVVFAQVPAPFNLTAPLPPGAVWTFAPPEERRYVVGKAEVPVWELKDVLAVRIGAIEGNEERVAQQLMLFGTPLTWEQLRVAAASTEAERRAFEAGFDAFDDWVFVLPSPATREAHRSGKLSALPNALEIGGVVRRQSGALGIVTQRLFVQPTQGTPNYMLREVLDQYKLEPLDPDAGRAWEGGRPAVEWGKFEAKPIEVRVGGADAARDALSISRSLSQQYPGMFAAEPVMIGQSIKRQVRPDDPLYEAQWQWQKVDLEGAWAALAKANKLDRPVRIAVVDTCFDWMHEDLRGAIAFNVCGTFRISPDAGDHVARAFIHHSSSPMPRPGELTAQVPNSLIRRWMMQGQVEETTTNRNHGTFIAGLLGALSNNKKGTSGGVPGCELMLLTIPNGTLSQEALALAIGFATNPSNKDVSDEGADILVCSLGGLLADEPVKNLLRYYLDLASTAGRRRFGTGFGMPIFWATENAAGDTTEDELFALRTAGGEPLVVPVVRSDRNDAVPAAGVKGDAVALAAPGVNVYSTVSGNDYSSGSGASYAAPVAAACAALLLKANSELHSREVRLILTNTADRIGPPEVLYDVSGHHPAYGCGRVNARRAVQLALQQATVVLQQNRTLDLTVAPGAEAQLRFSWRWWFFKDSRGTPTNPTLTLTHDAAAGFTVAALRTSPPRFGTGEGDTELRVTCRSGASGQSRVKRLQVRCAETDEHWDLQITLKTLSA